MRPRKKVPVVRTTAPAAISRPSASRTPLARPDLIRRSSASRLDYFEVRNGPDRSLHRVGIEFPVSLGPRAAHSRAFSTIEDTELDAAEIGDSGHKAIQSIDFPNQMAFSKPANSGITGHSADSAKPVRYEGGLRAHTGGRRRGFTAGVAAANHNDVESMRHQNLGWRVLAEARGGVKIIGFKENVSRETLLHPSKNEPIWDPSLNPQPLWKTRPAIRPVDSAQIDKSPQ